jgi:prevent-host-death family protein
MAIYMATDGDDPPKQYSIAQARDRLPGIVHEVERGAPVELTRRGRPVAVIVSLRQFQRLASNRPDFWTELERFRASVELEQLAIEPELFEGVRDTSPGRDPAFE